MGPYNLFCIYINLIFSASSYGNIPNTRSLGYLVIRIIIIVKRRFHFLHAYKLAYGQ